MEKKREHIEAEDINSAVSCLDVLAMHGYSVSRMKRSGNKLKGLSAFREEKDASMYYYIADNRIWDFGGMPYLSDGRQMKGSAIDLWMYYRGVSFVEAVNQMVEYFGLDYLRGGVKGAVGGVMSGASKDGGSRARDESGSEGQFFRNQENVIHIENFCGKPVEQWRIDSDNAEIETVLGPLWQINEHWINQGLDLDLREEIDFEPRISEVVGIRYEHEYFLEKGIYPQTAEAFGAGFWPGGGGIWPGIIFPIFSPGISKNSNKYFLIDYVRRTLDGETKYLAPEGMKKSNYLFNLDKIINPTHRMRKISGAFVRAREELLAKQTREMINENGIILVEGFSDAMKLHQEGFPNVVASMGCNLSERQALMLKNPKINPRGKVTIFYDNDGKDGTMKGIEAAKMMLEADSVFLDAWGKERVFAGVEVKVVNYDVIPVWTYDNRQNEPEHFDREWLEALLWQESVWSRRKFGAWSMG